MRISPTGCRNRGFTLIEIVVALFVLGLLVALGAKIWTSHSSRLLASTTQRASQYLHLVRDRALIRHQIHRVYWDLDRQEARCMVVTPGGEEQPVRDPYIPSVWQWSPTVRLRDMWTAEQGRIQGGQLVQLVTPRGQIQPAAFHFQTSTISTTPATTTMILRVPTGTPEILHGDVVYPPPFESPR